MVKVVVSMMVRNEADRHLLAALESAREVANLSRGLLHVTDDASDDETFDICLKYADQVDRNEEPRFWKHEGQARNEHYQRTSALCEPGDWVLSLDADETINRPDRLVELVQGADGYDAIMLPLYEFWTRTHYRVDGYWHGTKATRLYRWKSGGLINDVEMGCGSEPTYVRTGKRLGQSEVHLLHWGYVNPADRVRKHAAYTSRLNGHGHNRAHVDSIISKQPVLRPYNWAR